MKHLVCDGCLDKFPALEGETILALRDRARAAGWIGPMDRFPTNLDRCPPCVLKMRPPTAAKKKAS